MLAHKTFHRYTVRAKRGTAQSVRDAQQGGHQPKYVSVCALTEPLVIYPGKYKAIFALAVRVFLVLVTGQVVPA